MKYSLQEMNTSGFAFYEIIDTDTLEVVFRTNKYNLAIERFNFLNNTENETEV